MRLKVIIAKLLLLSLFLILMFASDFAPLLHRGCEFDPPAVNVLLQHVVCARLLVLADKTQLTHTCVSLLLTFVSDGCSVARTAKTH